MRLIIFAGFAIAACNGLIEVVARALAVRCRVARNSRICLVERYLLHVIANEPVFQSRFCCNHETEPTTASGMDDCSCGGKVLSHRSQKRTELSGSNPHSRRIKAAAAFRQEGAYHPSSMRRQRPSIVVALRLTEALGQEPDLNVASPIIPHFVHWEYSRPEYRAASSAFANELTR